MRIIHPLIDIIIRMCQDHRVVTGTGAATANHIKPSMERKMSSARNTITKEYDECKLDFNGWTVVYSIMKRDWPGGIPDSTT